MCTCTYTQSILNHAFMITPEKCTQIETIHVHVNLYHNIIGTYNLCSDLLAITIRILVKFMPSDIYHDNLPRG